MRRWSYGRVSSGELPKRKFWRAKKHWDAITTRTATPLGWPVVACGGMSIGHKAMLTAARTLSGAAVELLVSPAVVEAAAQAFEAKMNGQKYTSPVPADQEPPLPERRD